MICDGLWCTTKLQHTCAGPRRNNYTPATIVATHRVPCDCLRQLHPPGRKMHSFVSISLDSSSSKSRSVHSNAVRDGGCGRSGGGGCFCSAGRRAVAASAHVCIACACLRHRPTDRMDPIALLQHPFVLACAGLDADMCGALSSVSVVVAFASGGPGLCARVCLRVCWCAESHTHTYTPRLKTHTQTSSQTDLYSPVCQSRVVFVDVAVVVHRHGCVCIWCLSVCA